MDRGWESFLATEETPDHSGRLGRYDGKETQILKLPTAERK